MSTTVQLPAYSMYWDTPVYSDDGQAAFGLWVNKLYPDSTDTLYEIRQPDENSLGSVSQRFYGTPMLWWVIAANNQIFDPITEVAAGLKLRIPARLRLQQLGILKS